MNELLEKMTSEMRIQGVISFARFMELALYCPVYGYYEKEGDTVGRNGDFYTNVSVGSLFGKLLASQFSEWLQNTPKSQEQGPNSIAARPLTQPESQAHKTRIVEAGAHKGALAADILRWVQAWHPELFKCLEYCIIEPSERRRKWQAATLGKLSDQVHWVNAISELATIPYCAGNAPCSNGIRGIIFCNELLDAMPVHRWGWNAKQQVWAEWGVSERHGRFVWARMENSPRAVAIPDTEPSLGVQSCSALLGGPPQVDARVLEVLPDGFTVERCPAAANWWLQAAGILEWGKLVAIDYGLTAEELLVPERKEGTLRAYHRHRLSSDVLRCPGDQDLTAHVNFTCLEQRGQSAGLKTESLLTQAQFLTRIAGRIWSGELCFETWTSQHTRQFQMLTHPQYLGRAFKVLIQSR